MRPPDSSRDAPGCALSHRVTEKDLFILFSQRAGKVTDIYLITDKHSNRSKARAPRGT